MGEVEDLRAEVERLHTWAGLMELLDEHWPEDIIPTYADSEGRDPGPRIVSLLRWVDRAEARLRKVEELADRVPPPDFVRADGSEVRDGCRGHIDIADLRAAVAAEPAEAVRDES